MCTHLTYIISCFSANDHSSFSIDAKFHTRQFFTFRPPYFLGKHTCSHATRKTFFLTSILTHKYSIYYLSTCLSILCGRINTKPQMLWRENNTNLISCNHPTYDRCVAEEALILAVILSISCIQSSLFHFFGESGSPKYLIGNTPATKPVLVISLFLVSSSTPTMKMLDLSKFATRPVVLVKC